MRALSCRVLLCLSCTILHLCGPASGPAQAHEDIDRQIIDATRRIAESPDDATLRLSRGELHRMRRHWVAAEVDYEAARRLEPGLAEVDLCLGWMRLEQGRPGDARDALDRYLSRRPEDPRGWLARARCLVALDDPLAAAADYARAIGLYRPPAMPEPDHYLERARALIAASPSLTDEALAGLDEGIARLGGPVTLQLAAIDLELDAGRIDEALRRLDEAASASRRQEAWLQRRGAILEKAGRLVEARAAYRGALAAVADLPPARRGTKQVADQVRQTLAALSRLEGSVE